MSQLIIQLNYVELQQIAKAMQGESQDIIQLHSTVRSRMEALKNDWIGDAANAFFREMDGKLLPATQRAGQAMNESEAVLNRIIRIIHDADMETADYFRGFDDNFKSDLSRILPFMPPTSWLKGFHIDGFGGFDGSILENSGSDGKLIGGKPELGVEGKIGVGNQWHDGGAYQLGKWDLGVKGGLGEKGFSAGLYGEFDAFKAEATGVVGSSIFGFTVTGGASAGSADGFVGLKDNDFGASVGGSLVAGEVGLGFNIAGFNIRLVGGVGAGAELGFQIGDDTRVKLGPFKLGLSFGKALENTSFAN